MKTMTSEDIAAIERRLAAATPGHWKEGKIPGTIVAEPGLVSEEPAPTAEIIERYGGVPVASDVGPGDREFILNAKRDIRRLLDYREVLLNRINELEGQWCGRSRT